jgi:hypothetical protein
MNVGVTSGEGPATATGAVAAESGPAPPTLIALTVNV